jgi:hypothetical protein
MRRSGSFTLTPKMWRKPLKPRCRAKPGTGTFQIVAGRDDALFDWREAAEKIGYAPSHNWPEIPIAKS